MKSQRRYLIILLLGCILCAWTCTPRAGENKTVIPQRREYPQFKHIRFDYCDDCLSGEEIREYEDSLGGKELRLSILEIAQMFRYVPYNSQDSSGNYNSDPMIGSHFASQFNSYFAFERTVPELSPLRVAVLYSLNNPSMELPYVLDEVEWKFFFKDPIAERSMPSKMSLSEIDTGYVWALYDTLVGFVSEFFPANSEFPVSNSESGYFEVEQDHGWWLQPKEEIDFWGSKCPLDDRPYFFPDWHRHYLQTFWYTEESFGGTLRKVKVSGSTMALGWSSSPDYYHRTKWPPDSRIHWFDVKPTDLAIYLVLTAGRI